MSIGRSLKEGHHEKGELGKSGNREHGLTDQKRRKWTMDKEDLNKFEDEIEFQCNSVLFALKDLGIALGDYRKAHGEKFKHGEERIYIYRIWYFIQAFLVAAANISKLLDPPRPRRPKDCSKKVWKIKEPKLSRAVHERGVELKKSLSIKKTSPVLKRDARNYLEHFDTILQEWIEETKRRRYVPYVHRSIGSIRRAKKRADSPNPKDYLQFFDHERYILLFRGVQYRLNPIIRAAKKLLRKIRS